LSNKVYSVKKTYECFTLNEIKLTIKASARVKCSSIKYFMFASNLWLYRHLNWKAFLNLAFFLALI
jgi:hypothetical protein